MVHRRRDLHHDASSGRPGDALWKTHGTGHLFSFVDFPSRVKHFLINFEIKMNRISSTSNFTIETYLMSYTNIWIYIIYINIINIISNFCRPLERQWCQNQECVPIVDRPRQIDGGWGEWGSWSECSRTCGAGVSIVERKCDHPEPAHSGKFCIGERRRYKICNTEPCPEGTPSFRAVQCSHYDDKEYKGKNYTWLPYFDQSKRPIFKKMKQNLSFRYIIEDSMKFNH